MMVEITTNIWKMLQSLTCFHICFFMKPHNNPVKYIKHLVLFSFDTNVVELRFEPLVLLHHTFSMQLSARGS